MFIIENYLYVILMLDVFENIFSKENANTDKMEGIKLTLFTLIGLVAFTLLVSNNGIKILFINNML